MIPCIRSLSELMAITESRGREKDAIKTHEMNSSNLDNGQRKRYINSFEKKEINLPNLPKTKRRKWICSKEALSRFFDDLDYNDQIQSTYDLTLLERQNNNNQQDAA